MAYPTITFGSNAGTNGSGAIVITKPAGAQVGDVFLVMTYTRTQYPTSTPSGWTLIGSAIGSGANPETQAYYRVCDGTEGSSFAFAAASFQGGSAMIAYVSGADPASPIDTSAQNVFGSASASIPPPPVTTTSNQTLIVYGVHAGNSGGSATLSAPGSVTVLNTTNGTYSKSLAWSNGPASPGTVTPAAWTSSLAAYWANMTVAFKPAQAINNPPTASMTATPSAPSVGDTVTFNTNAVDPEGGALSFAWTLLTAPAGSGSSLVPNGLTATIAVDMIGTYTARCIVTDDHNQSVTVSATVVAKLRVRTKAASGTAWTGSVRRRSVTTSWQNTESFSPAVTLVGKSAGASSFAATITPSLPSTIQAGDVMYAVASSNGVTVSAPAGWTLVNSITASTSRCYAWRKVAVAGETAPAFSMTGSNGWGVAVYVFRGVNASTPEAQSAIGGGSASRETTLGLLNIPVNGCAALYVASQTSIASNDLMAFNVAKKDYSAYTDGNGRFITGSETNLPTGTIGRSIFWERLGNTAIIGIIIRP